jgi:hypothetical protein
MSSEDIRSLLAGIVIDDSWGEGSMEGEVTEVGKHIWKRRLWATVWVRNLEKQTMKQEEGANEVVLCNIDDWHVNDSPEGYFINLMWDWMKMVSIMEK